MTFYPDVFKIGAKLEDSGWKVLYPESALIMKQKDSFDPKKFRKNITTKDKGNFIKLHFRKELKSDAILIVNNTKNGIRGYIGGNALMEMGIAFQAGIKIYLLNAYPKTGPFHDEVSAMEPIILNGNIDSLSKPTS